MQIVSISASSDSPELDPRSDEDFSRLVETHHRDLLVYAQALTGNTATARDVVQEAFIVAHEKIGAFDVTRDFGAWMRGIVRNKWREWVRKNQRYALTDSDLARIDADVAQWQSTRAEGESDLFIALEECLSRLPDSLMETIRECYFEGRTSDEASARLDVAPTAVRKRLQRARDLLRECLEQKSHTSSLPIFTHNSNVDSVDPES